MSTKAVMRIEMELIREILPTITIRNFWWLARRICILTSGYQLVLRKLRGSPRSVHQKETGHEQNQEKTWIARMRWTDISFTHAMYSGVCCSNRHVSIPANSFKDWFQRALVLDLCSSRLVVYRVDPKRYVTTWVFHPKKENKMF